MNWAKYLLARHFSLSATLSGIEIGEIADAISLTLLRWPMRGGCVPFQGSPAGALAGRNNEESLCRVI